MPIRYDEESNTWILENPSQAEAEKLIDLGKEYCVRQISNLAFQQMLMSADDEDEEDGVEVPISQYVEGNNNLN